MLGAMIPSWFAHWQHGVREVPRWVFLASLVYAPWAYGCTTEKAIEGLNYILAIQLAWWVIVSAITRPRPIVPGLLVVAVAGVLFLGWWMVLNAKSIYDSEALVFVPVQRIADAAPGSVDRAISLSWMIRATVMLGVTCFVADLSRRSNWLLRLWWTVALAGTSIAFLGLLQKASGAEMIFWAARLKNDHDTFFGTYYYHSNAGAYLNLTFPLVTGLTVRAFTHRAAPLLRAGTLAMFMVILAALFANTSRMGQLLGGVATLAMLLGFRQKFKSLAQGIGWRTSVLVAIGVAVVLLAVLQAGRLDMGLKRWSQLGEHLPRDARWLVAEAAWRGLPEAGWFGFGPGTFREIFPYLTSHLGDEAGGVWRFLHQDYLQTALEWGFVGTVLWGVLFAAGTIGAFRILRSRRADEWTPRRRLLLPLVLLALATVLIHAVVDFPLQIASIQLYVATYLGICWGSLRWPREVEARVSRPSDSDG